MSNNSRISCILSPYFARGYFCMYGKFGGLATPFLFTK